MSLISEYFPSIILDGTFDYVLDDLMGHQCHLCQEHFVVATDFQRHLQEHGKQEQLGCSTCQQKFNSSTKLWSHLCRTHLAIKESYNCSLCNKIFKQAFNFHLHMLIHLEEQPEKCRFCSKAFRTKPSLRKHELIHTGIKRHPCKECNAKFKTRDELKQHGISHTTGTPYHCQFCSLPFKYQGSLRRHEKKGKCQIGKHWCPTKKRRRRRTEASVSCSSNGPSDEDNAASDIAHPLFCDVFLGWESATSVLTNNNHFSSTMEIFSF